MISRLSHIHSLACVHRSLEFGNQLETRREEPNDNT
jgi:hypothetical protein